MNKNKRVLVIILSVLFIISFAMSFASLALRAGVLSPAVYSSFMPRVNAYSGFYLGFKDTILKQTEYMELPEDLAAIPEEVFEEAVPEDYFNEKIGGLVGDGMGWLLYNQGEAELPINDVQDRLKEAIKNNETVAADTGNLDEIMNLALLTPLKGYIIPDEYPNTLRGFIYYFFTGGNEQFQANFDYYFDVVFYYYGNMLNWIAIGSVALTVLLFIVLLLINDDRKKTLNLAKIMLIISASVNAVAALAFWLGKPLFDSITETYREYIVNAHPLFDGLATVYAGFAAINVLLILIGVCVYKYISKNNKNKLQTKEAA